MCVVGRLEHIQPTEGQPEARARVAWQVNKGLGRARYPSKSASNERIAERLEVGADAVNGPNYSVEDAAISRDGVAMSDGSGGFSGVWRALSVGIWKFPGEFSSLDGFC